LNSVEIRIPFFSNTTPIIEVKIVEFSGVDKIFCVPNQGLLLTYNKIQKEIFIKTGDKIKLITLNINICYSENYNYY